MKTEGRELSDADKAACVRRVTSRFPDICLKHLSSIMSSLGYNADQIIHHILERQSLGEEYKKEQTEVITTLERSSTDGMNMLAGIQNVYADPTRTPGSPGSPGSPGFELTQVSPTIRLTWGLTFDLGRR